MTTVITRAYADEQSAKGIRERLYREGFPRHQMSVISANGRDRATVVDKLTEALVPEGAAETYADRIMGGASVVVLRATYKPLNAVRKANDTFHTSGAMDVGIAEQQFRVPTPVDHAPSVLKDHPRFFTMKPHDEVRRATTVTEELGLPMPLLSAPKVRNSAISGGRMMLGGSVRRGRNANSAIRGGKHMSRAFWPMPLVSKKRSGLSVIPGGGHPFSRLLGWPTIS